MSFIPTNLLNKHEISFEQATLEISQDGFMWVEFGEMRNVKLTTGREQVGKINQSNAPLLYHECHLAIIEGEIPEHVNIRMFDLKNGIYIARFVSISDESRFSKIMIHNIQYEIIKLGDSSKIKLTAVNDLTKHYREKLIIFEEK